VTPLPADDTDVDPPGVPDGGTPAAAMAAAARSPLAASNGDAADDTLDGNDGLPILKQKHN
jgi:hypothetical protein